MHYSVVVPMHDEETHVRPLYEALVSVMASLGRSYELVFVDDGSTDRTLDLLKDLVAGDGCVRAVKLRRNFGQTAALAAGFDHARGEVIVSMDADLQHDPKEIPLLVGKLEEGYDLVSGWRQQRRDSLARRVPSRAANWLMAKLSRVPIHDFGGTFKAYRREILQEIRLYGEHHRFIPALASWQGARITEVPITNILRKEGKSHYGIGRAFRVLFDLITVKFLIHYVTRPLHFFGLAGLIGIGAGSLIGFVLLLKKILLGTHVFVAHGPLILLAAVLFISGVQLIGLGLVGELLTRTYFESKGKPVYAVEQVFERSEADSGS
jgi:glycosyltransferase involved in cell wall biosynthesis